MTLTIVTPAESGGYLAICATDPELAAWGESPADAEEHLRCSFALAFGHAEDACDSCYREA